MARRSVLTVALLLTILAIKAGPAWRFAQETGPSGGTFALSVRIGAVASVFTSAGIGAIVSVTALRARILAVVTDVACVVDICRCL